MQLRACPQLGNQLEPAQAHLCSPVLLTLSCTRQYQLTPPAVTLHPGIPEEL